MNPNPLMNLRVVLDLRIVHRTKSNRYNPTNPNPLMNLWMVLDLRIVRRTKSHRHNAMNATNPNSLINLWIILARLDPRPRKLSRPDNLGSQWITLLNNTCTQSKNARPPKKIHNNTPKVIQSLSPSPKPIPHSQSRSPVPKPIQAKPQTNT